MPDRPSAVKIEGRVLYLTTDKDQLRAQLHDGANLPRDPARDLIDNIVAGKVSDGQLDESPLTLQEISQLKDEFVKVLSGVFHHRIDYPTTKHLTDAASPDDGDS